MSMISEVTIALPEPDSDDNAERWRHFNGIGDRHAATALEAYARAGEVLIEQRDLCRQETTRGGSSFSQWVDDNLSIDRSRASRQIKIAENWELLCAHNSSDEPLSVRGALRLIEESKLPVEKINRADIPKASKSAQKTLEVEVVERSERVDDEPEPAVDRSQVSAYGVDLLPAGKKTLVLFVERDYEGDEKRFLFIERHASDEAEWWFVAYLISPDGNNAGFKQGNKRAFRADGVKLYVEDTVPERFFKSAERIEGDSDRLTYNQWLFDSLEDYHDQERLEWDRLADKYKKQGA